MLYKYIGTPVPSACFTSWNFMGARKLQCLTSSFRLIGQPRLHVATYGSCEWARESKKVKPDGSEYATTLRWCMESKRHRRVGNPGRKGRRGIRWRRRHGANGVLEGSWCSYHVLDFRDDLVRKLRGVGEVLQRTATEFVGMDARVGIYRQLLARMFA